MRRVFNASNVLGAIAFLAMVGATGAEDNLILGLLLTAVFAVCAHLSIREDGGKR